MLTKHYWGPWAIPPILGIWTFNDQSHIQDGCFIISHISLINLKLGLEKVGDYQNKADGPIWPINGKCWTEQFFLPTTTSCAQMLAQSHFIASKWCNIYLFYMQNFVVHSVGGAVQNPNNYKVLLTLSTLPIQNKSFIAICKWHVNHARINEILYIWLMFGTK